MSSYLQLICFNTCSFVFSMLSDVWFLLVTFCCTAWIVWVFLSSWRIHPPLPPGPKGLPVVGSLPFLDPELHYYFAGLAKRYGGLVSLWLGEKMSIVVGSPSIAKEVLKDLDVTFANRDVPAAARVSSYGGFDIAWLPYGPEWKMLRRVCVREMLGSASLKAVYNLRKHEIHQTMLYLRQQEGSLINIGDQMFLTAMNVMTSMLWGGTVKDEERTRVGADFRAVVSEITDLVGAPNLSDFFPWLARFDLQGIVKRMRDCVKRLDSIFEEIIDRRRKMEISTEKGEKDHNVEDGKDFLQFLLKLTDDCDPKTPFNMVHLKALLMDMIVGGTDTTSNTIEFAMAEIMNKPEVMRKAQQELETVVGAGNPVEETHIHQLPFLQAIMKEALRLHPILPLLVPHSPTQSCIVGGYTIPKGSKVFINAWSIHRDPSHWEDPLEFKPERFMDGKHDFMGNDFTYIPFGSGRRICAGTAMAERMVLFSLASLLHYFDWKLPEGCEKLDLSERFGITLKKRTPLLLIPSSRSSSNLEGIGST